jgi:hypothetical protein
MNILNIIVISIFIIFVITYIVMISSLNLNPNIDLNADDDNNNNNLLTKRNNDINNLNIIGTIVGILLGVIDMNYINRLQITNEKFLIGINTIKLIIYVTLICLAGTTYSDFYKYIETELKIDNPNTSNKLVNDYAKWSIAIKPLVPFLSALSIQSLIIIITNIEKIIPNSHRELSLPDNDNNLDDLPSPEN